MPKIKEIVKLYKKVQRIPYYCLKERNSDLLLKKNKGSCSEKHLFLGKEFEKLGVPVKYLLIRFDWNDLPIPKEIINKKEDGPIGWHLALKIRHAKSARSAKASRNANAPMRIKSPNKWVYVDATWDSKLEKVGFPITKNWSSLSDTKFAFPPKKIIELKKAPPKQIKRPEKPRILRGIK